LALKLAVAALEGKPVPKTVILPLPLVTNDTIKLCQEGTWEEMKGGCNAFKPSIVPNPGWFASIYSPETPEAGLNAALVGQPEF
jgi:ribose transport system substrate-binding protein